MICLSGRSNVWSRIFPFIIELEISATRSSSLKNVIISIKRKFLYYSSLEKYDQADPFWTNFKFFISSYFNHVGNFYPNAFAFEKLISKDLYLIIHLDFLENNLAENEYSRAKAIVFYNHIFLIKFLLLYEKLVAQLILAIHKIVYLERTSRNCL